MVKAWQEPEVRLEIWRKQGGRCYYGYPGVCRMHTVEGPTDRNWTIDHVHSQHRHPHLADEPSNWVGACRSCNSSKGVSTAQNLHQPAFKMTQPIANVLRSVVSKRRVV